MSRMLAPAGVTDPEEPVAEAPVNVTVPKFANGTRPPLDEKSSTIHSALSSCKAALCPLKVCVTVCPLDTFCYMLETCFGGSPQKHKKKKEKKR